MRTGIRTALLFGAVVVTLGACGPGTPKSTPSSPSATSASATVPSPSAGTGAPTALDAYRGMWKAYVEAIRIPDPGYPDVARYSQGNALNVWVRGLTSVRDQGLVGQGDVRLNPKVKTVNPNATPPTVEIEDCVDTSQTRLVKKDGSPYQDTPGGNRSARATAAQISEGVWKVTEFALFGVGTC